MVRENKDLSLEQAQSIIDKNKEKNADIAINQSIFNVNNDENDE